MLVALIAVAIFVLVAVANLRTVIAANTTADARVSSPIFLIGPLAWIFFMAINPWELSGWWWLVMALDVGTLLLLAGVLIEIYEKLFRRNSGQG